MPRTLLAMPLIAALASPLTAQVPLSPHSLGMAGASLAGVRGQEALFLNPANLGLPGNPHWSVAAPQVVVGAALAGPSVGDLRDLVGLDDLPDPRRDELFARVPADGAELRLDLRAPLASFQWRRVAVGVAYAASITHGLSRDVAELLLYGFEDGRVDYDADGTTGTQLTFWDVAAAYGDRTGRVSWGVTGHYLRGGTLLRTRTTVPRVDLEASDIDVDYVAIVGRGGHGFAIDVGVAFQPRETVTLSAAAANAFATMSWSDDLRIRSLHLTRTELDDVDLSELRDRFRASERAVGPDDERLAGDLTAATLHEGAYLPTTARLGADWRVAPRTHLGLSFYSAITDGRMAGSWDRMLAAGAQHSMPVVTVRAGVATDFDGGSLLSSGLSLGPIQLSLSRLNDGDRAGAPRRGWVGAVGFATATRSRMP